MSETKAQYHFFDRAELEDKFARASFCTCSKRQVCASPNIEQIHFSKSLFFNKVKKIDGGCWNWIGAKNKQRYAHVRVGDSYFRAHRASYIMAKGVISSGLVIDHLCRNPSCVNPEHLEPVSHRENMMRGKDVTKTHCDHGHERTPENTYVIRRSNGKVFRNCRVCHQIKRREKALAPIGC